jgi:hypothetical protein
MYAYFYKLGKSIESPDVGIQCPGKIMRLLFESPANVLAK